MSTPRILTLERPALIKGPGFIYAKLIRRTRGVAPVRHKGSVTRNYEYQKQYQQKQRDTLKALKANPELYAELLEEVRKRDGNN